MNFLADLNDAQLSQVTTTHRQVLFDVQGADAIAVA